MVPREGEPLHPVLRGPFDEDRQVVSVDVVSGDDVRIQLIDELHEPLDDLLLVAGEDAGLDFARFAVCDPDAEDVAVPDRIFDVKAEDPEGGTERVARLEPFRHKEQVCPVSSLRILGRPHDSDGRPEIHIIDEPMLERDVRLQRS